MPDGTDIDWWEVSADSDIPLPPSRVPTDAELEFGDERPAFLREPFPADLVVLVQQWQLCEQTDPPKPMLFEGDMAFEFEYQIRELLQPNPLYVFSSSAVVLGGRALKFETSRNGIVTTVAVVSRSEQIARLRALAARSGHFSAKVIDTIELAEAEAIADALDALGCWEDQTHAGLPTEEESSAAWARRVAIPGQKLEGKLRQLEMCRGNLALLSRMGSGAKQSPPEFLVPELIPKGCITLLGGARKEGKSTILTELAVTAGAGGGHWCGRPVLRESCQGLTLLFCGEDPLPLLGERLARMGAEDSHSLVSFPSDTHDLFTELDGLSGLPVSLLIVDPVRKYYAGDEDGSDAANSFLTRLEEFAGKTGCAVVLSHHLKKDARPRNLEDVAQSIRGSGVWLDRPRVILSLLRRNNETLLGIPAPNGSPLHNFPSEMMLREPIKLSRDAATHKHIPAARPPVKQKAEAPGSVAESVLLVLVDLVGSGERVTKSGKAGLFERRDPRLVELSRANVHAAIDELLAAGELVISGGCLALMPKQAVAAG